MVAGVEFLKPRCAYVQGLSLIDHCEATLFESSGDSGGLAVVQGRNRGSADQFGEDLVAVFFKGYHLDEIEGHQVGEHLPVVVLAASLVLELQHNLLCNENLVR